MYFSDNFPTHTLIEKVPPSNKYLKQNGLQTLCKSLWAIDYPANRLQPNCLLGGNMAGGNLSLCTYSQHASQISFLKMATYSQIGSPRLLLEALQDLRNIQKPQ